MDLVLYNIADEFITSMLPDSRNTLESWPIVVGETRKGTVVFRGVDVSHTVDLVFQPIDSSD